MGFLDLFSNPSSPLAILTAAGAPPAGTTPAGLQPSPSRGLSQLARDPSADGQLGLLNLSSMASPPLPGQNAAPWDHATQNIDLSNPNLYAGYGRSYTFTPDQAAPPSTQSISDLINSLLGPQPTLDQLFNAQPYQQMLDSLAKGKDTAAKGIGDSYTKALQDLASVSAAAKADQAKFAQSTAGNNATASNAQQAFLNSIGIGAAGNSALGAMLSGQAARMANDQANQANTTARLASVQNNDLSQAQQDAALGQMGSLNQLNTAVAGAQSKVTQQESADRSSALKELASMLSSRQSQAGSLLNNAESFIGKNATSTNSRDAVQQQLTQMQQGGDSTTPSLFQSIVYGGDKNPDGSYTVGAKNEAEAIKRLQAATSGQGGPHVGQPLSALGVDPATLQALIHGFYANSTAQQAPPMDALKQYLSALMGAGS